MTQLLCPAELVLIQMMPVLSGWLQRFIASNSILFLKGKEIILDSLSLSANSGEDSTHLILNSSFLKAGLTANHSLSQLPVGIEQLLYRVYPGQKPENRYEGNHWMSLNVSIDQHDLLSTLIPDLKLLQPLTITGEFDVSKKDSFLFFKATTPAFSYNKLNVDQLLIEAENIDSATRFTVAADKIRSGSDTLMQPSVSGRLKDDLVTFSARVDDSDGDEYYAAKASVQIAEDSTVVRLLDNLTINHNKWTVPTDNRVVMIKDGFIINNLSLASRGQSISISQRRSTNIIADHYKN